MSENTGRTPGRTALDTVADAAVALTVTAESVRAQAKHQHTQTIQALGLVAVVGLVAASALVVVIGVVSATKQLASDVKHLESQRTQIAAQNQKILHEIESCTTETGECSQRGARRTGEAVGKISGDQRAIGRCQVKALTSSTPLATYGDCLKDAFPAQAEPRR